MVQQIGAACLQQGEILPCIRLRQRSSRDDLRAAAVHLERADSGNNDHRVWRESRHAALYIEELFGAEICAESCLCDRHIRKL